MGDKQPDSLTSLEAAAAALWHPEENRNYRSQRAYHINTKRLKCEILKNVLNNSATCHPESQWSNAAFHNCFKTVINSQIIMYMYHIWMHHLQWRLTIVQYIYIYLDISSQLLKSQCWKENIGFVSVGHQRETLGICFVWKYSTHEHTVNEYILYIIGVLWYIKQLHSLYFSH